MAEFGAPATLNGGAGFIDFNDWASAGANGTIWLIQNIDGLDGFPLRTPMDDKAGETGAWIHSFYGSARHITVSGLMLPNVLQPMGAQIAERNTMEQALRLIGKSMMAPNQGSWSWTPTGLGGYSLNVFCDVQPIFPGQGIKEFIFGLVAGEPDYD